MFSSDLLFFNNALKMSEAIYYHLGRGGYSERTLGQFSGSHGEKNPEKGIGAGETPRGKSESWKWKLISMERSLPQQMRHSLRSQSGERRKRPQRRLLYLFFFFLSFPSSQFLKISRPVWGRPFPRFKSQRVKLCGIWASLFLSSPDVFSISVFFSALFSPYLPVGLSHSFSPVFVFFGPCLEERKNSQLKKKNAQKPLHFYSSREIQVLWICKLGNAPNDVQATPTWTAHFWMGCVCIFRLWTLLARPFPGNGSEFTVTTWKLISFL